MSWESELSALASPKGSTGIALTAFLSATVFNVLRALESIWSTIFPGLIFAAFSVAIVQTMARLSGKTRDYVLLALGSAGLLVSMAGTAIFRAGGDVSWPIVLAIWGGISLAALVLVEVYRRT